MDPNFLQTSRDMLVAFSRDYLSGEGDIVKHLAYLGYKVNQVQVPLDEFDYAVTNIAVDLRCGIRLWYVSTVLISSVLLSALPSSYFDLCVLDR